MPFDQRLQFAIAEMYSLQSDAMYKRLVSNARMKHPNATFQGIECHGDLKVYVNKANDSSINFEAAGISNSQVVWGSTGPTP